MNKAAAALLLFALVAPAAAVRPIALPAPDFPKGLLWLNSPELSLRGLRKRNVMVVAFFSLSSENSLRVMSRVDAWAKRYANAGLLVVAVHTPDFDFEKDPNVVRAEAQRLELSMPVVLDNNREIWKAYAAQGWPSLFLVDQDGRILFDHLGEGRYQEFEVEILGALERLNGYSPKDYWPAPDPFERECGKATPTRYTGSARGRMQRLGDERGRLLAQARDGEIAYRGKWKVGADSVLSERASQEGSQLLRLIYRGAASLALAKSAGTKPVPVYVKQDDFFLNEKNAGPDVRFDKSKRSFVLVSDPRFYGITRNGGDEEHELVFYPALPGLEVYEFEFANTCQNRSAR